VLAGREGAWYYRRDLNPLTFGFTGEQPSIQAHAGRGLARLPRIAVGTGCRLDRSQSALHRSQR
jgi:hypothetical protein